MKNSKHAPEVSVVLCHHKGDFIYKAVDSIKKSIGLSFEIIVITSDDKLAETGIDGCLVMNGPAMPAAKRNMGIRLAKSRYIAFFDDDVEIDRTCLYNLYRPLCNIEIGMVYGKLWNMEHRDRFDEAGGFLTSTGFIWSRAGQNDVDTGQFDSAEFILAGKSASCMIRKDVIDKVGDFDEDFGILGEETDLSWRVWLGGYTVVFQPNATGYHAFNTRFKPAKDYYTSSRVHFNGCRNYITMLIKNLEVRNLWKILPVHCLIWFTASLAMLFTGKVRQGVNLLKGLAYVCWNLGPILEKRRKVQSRRVKSDSELWPDIFHRAPRGYYSQRFLRYLSIGLHG